ncbi:MAG: hypothetical protein AAF211_16415 [Myxococcota bacterium]
MQIRIPHSIAAALAIGCGSPQATGTSTPASPIASSIEGAFGRVTSLSFGPDNVLFVGDTTAGTISALDVGSDPAYRDGHFNLFDVDRTIAGHFGVAPHTLSIPDLAVHPETAEVYVAVAQTTPDATTSAIVKVTPSGQVVSIDASAASHHTLADPVASDRMFWGRVSARTYAITDMDYDDGYVYVSGLSNADFASTLHKVPYPFDGTEAASSVGIYHAAHGQTETRAPIRTQEIVELRGETYLLAAYTCTPLVLIAVDDVKPGAHITGKTIAELGYGNTPRDLFQVTAPDPATGQMATTVFLTNEHRMAKSIRLADIEAALDLPALDRPVDPRAVFAGVPFTPVPTFDSTSSAAQGTGRVLHLRNARSGGGLDLVSTPAGSYARLTDFVGEYDFPEWTCPPEARQMMAMGGTFAAMEGVDMSTIRTGRVCDER